MYSTREFIVAACFDLEGKQTKRTIDSKPFYFFGKFFKKKRGGGHKLSFSGYQHLQIDPKNY